MTNLVKKDPFDIFSRFFTVDNFFSRPTFASWPDSDWVLDGDKYLLRLEVPGFSQSDLKVNVYQENKVRVVGSVSIDNKFRHSSSSIDYSYSLPDNSDPETLEASYQSGVLLISVTRKTSSARELTIKCSEEKESK